MAPIRDPRARRLAACLAIAVALAACAGVPGEPPAAAGAPSAPVATTPSAVSPTIVPSTGPTASPRPTATPVSTPSPSPPFAVPSGAGFSTPSDRAWKRLLADPAGHDGELVQAWVYASYTDVDEETNLPEIRGWVSNSAETGHGTLDEDEGSDTIAFTDVFTAPALGTGWMRDDAEGATFAIDAVVVGTRESARRLGVDQFDDGEVIFWAVGLQ